jgi:chromosomal replication initiation ATPase DnaA
MSLTENREIENLLKNIHQGLKKYSIKELNQAILNFLNKKNDKSTEIDFVLNSVCHHFSISLNTLKKRNVRGNIIDAKQITYCLLHFNLGLSVRDISKNIFSNSPTAVSLGIKRLKQADATHISDKQFIEKYSVLEKKLVHHISLQTEKNLEINNR